MDMKVFFVFLVSVVLLGLGIKNYFYLERVKGSILLFWGLGFLFLGFFMQIKLNVFLFVILFVIYIAEGSKRILKRYNK